MNTINAYYLTNELAKIMEIQSNSVQGILDKHPEVIRAHTTYRGKKRICFDKTSTDKYLNDRGYLGRPEVTFDK